MQDIASEIVLNRGAKEGTKIRAVSFAGHWHLKLEGHVMLLNSVQYTAECMKRSHHILKFHT
jgi:hypothetical protein